MLGRLDSIVSDWFAFVCTLGWMDNVTWLFMHNMHYIRQHVGIMLDDSECPMLRKRKISL